MAPRGIIPSFDKGKKGHAGFGFGLKRSSVDQFTFQRGFVARISDGIDLF
jgi:hypothetical protein